MKQVKVKAMMAISPNHKRNKIPHPAFSASVFVFIGAPEMAKPWGKSDPPGLRRNENVVDFQAVQFGQFHQAREAVNSDAPLKGADSLLGQADVLADLLLG